MPERVCTQGSGWGRSGARCPLTLQHNRCIIEFMNRFEGETIFTGHAGGNCTLKEIHGYVTAFHKEGPHVVAAFVKVPVCDGSGPMLFVRLGRNVDETHREVVSVRPIDRDEFDRLNTLDTLRHDLGWR
jgi:hypothetical protein